MHQGLVALARTRQRGAAWEAWDMREPRWCYNHNVVLSRVRYPLPSNLIAVCGGGSETPVDVGGENQCTKS